jgi:hypothetical protein
MKRAGSPAAGAGVRLPMSTASCSIKVTATAV